MIYRIIVLLVLVTSCISPDQPYGKLAPGYWRGILKIDDRLVNTERREPTLESIGQLQMESVTEGELPFLWEVIPEGDSFYIELINGAERIPVRNISMGRNKRTAYDTIRIDFPLYDSYIRADINAGMMEGGWVINYRQEKDGAPYSIPLVMEHGLDTRFDISSRDPGVDVTGRWAVEFLSDTPYPAIGEFKQEGQRVTGTFRTETGDYRYLAGTRDRDKMYLSVFDGSHAFLFESKLLDDDTMIGSFKSGKHYQVGWKATRDPEASLASPDSLTRVTHPGERMSLRLPGIDGKTIDLSDSRYDDKIILVKVMGTWCPNCRDETLFLKDYLADHPQDDLAIVSVGFERYRDTDRSLAALERYREQMDIPWDIAYGGYANKAEASEVFPMLSRILSYPTLIFLDKHRHIRRVHTGFNGPATSAYADWERSFQRSIDEIRAENSK